MEISLENLYADTGAWRVNVPINCEKTLTSLSPLIANIELDQYFLTTICLRLAWYCEIVTFHAKTYTNGFVLNGQKPTANQRVANGFSNGFNGFLNAFNGCAKTFNGL